MADGIIPKEGLKMIEPGIAKGGMLSGPSEQVTEKFARVLCANRNEKGAGVPYMYTEAFRDIMYVTSWPCSLDTEMLRQRAGKDYQKRFLERMQSVVWNRRVFSAYTPRHSGQKLIGLAPQRAEDGDQIWILTGCSVPVVLRGRGPSGKFELIGDCFVDGNMDGEACYNESEDGLPDTVEIEIW